MFAPGALWRHDAGLLVLLNAEVIAAFVATDGQSSKVDRGTVFDRFTQFRTGFEGGPNACLSA